MASDQWLVTSKSEKVGGKGEEWALSEPTGLGLDLRTARLVRIAHPTELVSMCPIQPTGWGCGDDFGFDRFAGA